MWRVGFFLVVFLLTRHSFAGDRAVFDREVRPIFARACFDCHRASEQNGGLRFDDPTTLLTVADSGLVAIVPHDPASSELVRRISSGNEDERMPPVGQRLTEHEIKTIENWIAGGANWPDANDADHQPINTHWSFQSITQPQPPRVRDPSWPQTPIDRFLLATREAADFVAVAEASPTALIRRAHYALTGLPPTPDEVREFVSQVDSRGVDVAWCRLIDQLLGRPSYGERWGRHWMDWVRYADTAGDNSDFPIPQAYLYRNYLIDAFNSDLPYDRFITEQLAGDLLPADTLERRNRQVIATGYLAMARRFGSLIERYPWHLTIEDSIDNLGRTMLGLTIACARCHDHKFDPISARDYYGLYGIFASTRYPQPGLELFQTQHDLVPLTSPREYAETMRPYQAEIDKLQHELTKLLAACERRGLDDATSVGSVDVNEQRQRQGKLDAMLLQARRAGSKLADYLKTIPAVPSAYAVQDAVPQAARLQIKGEPTRLGAIVPRKFLGVLGGQELSAEVAATSSGRLELAQWIANPDNPLTARVFVNRVWQRHFGVGLVPTTSDFGLRGQPPTHPELLDWLAAEFIRGGWSIKHLQRLIMTSRTYRLSSQESLSQSQIANQAARDPDNQLYWRFNRGRLDAESIRDSLLQFAGALDLSPQTEPFPFPPREKWDFTQHYPFKDDYSSNRRSVYMMTKRLTATSYSQTFDGPDPNVCTSNRDQSVTPLQALYFVNDTFLHEQAAGIAQGLLDDHVGDDDRIQQAFQTILCRSPDQEESNLLHDHLAASREQVGQESSAEIDVWSGLVRSLLRLNEFMYVD